MTLYLHAEKHTLTYRNVADETCQDIVIHDIKPNDYRLAITLAWREGESAFQFL